MNPQTTPHVIPQVVFCGVDGAGKSTQIQRLAASLRQLGWEPVVLWTRIGYTPGMQGTKNLVRYFLRRQSIPPGVSAARTQALDRHWVRRWWIRWALLDLIWRWAVVARWYAWRGNPVIYDRYLMDSQIDIQLHFPGEKIESYWLWKLLVGLIPPPTVEFLLMVPVETYLRRSVAKNEPFPLTPERFLDRYELYAAQAQHSGRHVLDGELPVQVLAEEILATVVPKSATSQPIAPSA